MKHGAASIPVDKVRSTVQRFCAPVRSPPTAPSPPTPSPPTNMQPSTARFARRPRMCAPLLGFYHLIANPPRSSLSPLPPPPSQAKTNFIDKFLDTPDSTPVYLVLFSNPDVLLILRRPHNKQELIHYIPPDSSPPNVSHIWLVQHSLHLQTLQLSLPSAQTQTFTLTSPLSSIHITPSLSQSVSSVLNRSSDSNTSSPTWSEVRRGKTRNSAIVLSTNTTQSFRPPPPPHAQLLSSGIFNSHSLPPFQTPNPKSVTLSQSKSLPGLTAHQLVSGTPFSDAVKRKSSIAPFSLLKATEYDQFNLTPLHYSVLSSNKDFFTEALVQNPSITTNFIIDDKNGISILDVIALRGGEKEKTEKRLVQPHS